MRYVLLNIEHREVRSSNVCVKHFTGMPWSTLQSPHSEKMKEPFFSYENTLPFLAFLMACGRYGHVITTSTDPRSWERKAMSPSSTVHWGQYDTKYLVCNIRIDGASGIRGGENFIRLVS